MAWSDAARKAAAEARRRKARPKAPKIYGQEVFGGQLMYRTDPKIKYANMGAAGYHRTYGLAAAKKQGFGKKLRSLQAERDRAIEKMYKDVRKKLGKPTSYTHTQFSDEIIREARRRKL